MKGIAALFSLMDPIVDDPKCIFAKSGYCDNDLIKKIKDEKNGEIEYGNPDKYSEIRCCGDCAKFYYMTWRNPSERIKLDINVNDKTNYALIKSIDGANKIRIKLDAKLKDVHAEIENKKYFNEFDMFATFEEWTNGKII